jgi:hypothetical protein
MLVWLRGSRKAGLDGRPERKVNSTVTHFQLPVPPLLPNSRELTFLGVLGEDGG